MNYGKQRLSKKQKKLVSTANHLKHKTGVSIFRTFLVALVVFVIVCIFAGYGLMMGILDNAPSIDTIDVAPTGFATNLYDCDGKKIQRLVGSDANRIYRSIDQIPKVVQDAFIAIEDERFWTHNGIDIKGILRAAVTGISSGDFSQGASTLTQQLLKNQIFEGGNEDTLSARLERKIQEQYLAIQLENKLSKEQILEYYLNTINLGQNTLGVQAASKRYFGKDVSKLTLSEATVIAGITKNPSRLNPISNPEDNKERRLDVLNKMKELSMISEEEYNEALNDDVYSRIQMVNDKQTDQPQTAYTYFVDETIEQVAIDLQEKLGYTSTQAYNLIYRGGLKIYTTQDTGMQQICDEVINDPAMYSAVPSNYSLTYRITINQKDGTQVNYDEYDLQRYFKAYSPSFDLFFDSEDEAKPYIKRFRKVLLHKHKKTKLNYLESINYSIEPQVSFVLIDQYTGNVKAIVGGRGQKTSSLTFDRAMDSTRQPGSTFKILTTYLPALDKKGMTLATVINDTQYNYPGTDIQVDNWNGMYNGLTTLREGITNSMNVVTIKALEQVTPQTAYAYLLKLGFTTIVENRVTDSGQVFSDIGYPIALGGLTDGVTNFELTAAYAAIANGGVYSRPKYYTRIIDHNGNVLIDNRSQTSQVMKPSTAFLLTNAMRDVVTEGTGQRIRFQSSRMPIAGKTGSTTDDVDSWFVGYTPYLTAGIWSGYDNNKSLESTSFDKDIWRTIMERIHEGYEVKNFEVPDTIVVATICTKCGKLGVAGLCDSEVGGNRLKKEYFAKGTEPTENCDCHIKVRVCSKSNMKPSAYCPASDITYRVFLTKDDYSYSADSNYLLPSGFDSRYCTHHTPQHQQDAEPADAFSNDSTEKPGAGSSGSSPADAAEEDTTETPTQATPAPAVDTTPADTQIEGTAEEKPF